MKLLAVCLGSPEKLPGKSFKTGIYKSPVTAPVMIDRLGLVGDSACNTKIHGGEDQAILLEGSLTLDWWAAGLGRELPPGTFGENLVVEGLDNRDVAAGDRFHIGEIVLEATCPRSPCNTFAVKMGDPTFIRTYFRGGRPGIYCRVIRPGMIAAGDPVSHEPYAGDRVAIADMLAASGRNLSAAERERFLAAPIGGRWKAVFDN